jgi:glycosyltransferase involved in cell wall biosynthesis
MKILAHIPFIGTSGYANHARSFFTALNKYHKVKVRNFTIGHSWLGMNDTPHDGESYLTDEMKDMLILQTLWNNDGSRSDYNMYGYTGGFKPDVNIVLMETNNHYFYDNYEGYKIAYNVWESTRYPDDFFQRLFYFDEVWVPTQWQFDCLVEQGYPKEKIFVVPEGVDIDTFKPLKKLPKKNKFRFLHFGRWEYRKGTTEILKAFSETFSGRTDVELVCNVENAHPFDGMKTTEERVKYHNIDTTNIKFLNMLPRDEYVKYLQQGDVFVTCARSEGWNLPLIEAMSCGTPSIYSNWGGQLEFAEGKGIPVQIDGLRPANYEHKDWPGDYCEPDWNNLSEQMLKAFNDYKQYKSFALVEAKEIHEDFNWDKVAKIADNRLNKIFPSFAFVTTGNLQYMPVIEKLVQSLLEFSTNKIIVYGVDCEVPFDYSNVIKKTINPPKISEHDKWYWKQHACLESLNEGFDYLIWIDGDVVVNYNIDTVSKYFNQVGRYPLSDIHVQEEFFGTYPGGSQLFNEELAKKWGIEKQHPYMHICFFIYDEGSKDFFKLILKEYETLIDKEPENYKKNFLWNDEGIDNALRWLNGYTNHLPLSNFDTSSYDGDEGFIDKTMHQFLKFWNEEGPQNFNRIFGYQYIPKDKSQIIYFHGNKNAEISDKMIEFIKMKRDDSFYQSEYFYTDIYKLENLGDIKGVEGGTIDIANRYGWARAIYHEIFNLLDYNKYPERNKSIFEGDVVVDLGGNMGIFNRWAYHQGASKVISFEPDKRYFKLLSLNADPRSILFNAAIADTIGEFTLYQTEHLGGSTLLGSGDGVKYPVRTYTLDYLFETGLVDKIDFLKVDIEGAELHAFAGISDDNLIKVRNIAMEYHHGHLAKNEELRQGLIDRLNKLGFNSFLLFMGGNDELQMIYFSR